MFKDRREAGRALAQNLLEYKDDKNAIVLAIPRGGVVPGNEIAKYLGLPLELIIVKKIGHPANPEFAIGSASLNDYMITGKDGVSYDYFEEEVKRLRKKMTGQFEKFIGNRKPLDLQNKKVIIVDDGAATGTTLLMVIELVKKSHPKEIIVAIPVAPAETADNIDRSVSKLVCLEIPYNFNAVGEVYEEFAQVEDDEVAAIMQKYKSKT